jgi:hypothetical protein
VDTAIAASGEIASWVNLVSVTQIESSQGLQPCENTCNLLKVGNSSEAVTNSAHGLHSHPSLVKYSGANLMQL